MVSLDVFLHRSAAKKMLTFVVHCKHCCLQISNLYIWHVHSLYILMSRIIFIASYNSNTFLFASMFSESITGNRYSFTHTEQMTGSC